MTIRVFLSGSVRVLSAPSRDAAVAAYERVQDAVFPLRNEALPDELASIDLGDAESPPLTDSELGWAQLREELTTERNAAPVDDEKQTQTGDESEVDYETQTHTVDESIAMELAMSPHSNTSTWDDAGHFATGENSNLEVLLTRQ